MSSNNKNQKLNLDFLNQHKMPTTRRDFVSLGLALGGATLFTPTLRNLLPLQIGENAWADDVQAGGAIPMVVFDLAGGAALFANFLVGGKGGPTDLLPSYDLHGWNPRRDKINNQFGLPMADGGVSKILQGMKAAASAEALSFLRMSSLLHKGDVDTTNNAISAASLVTSAGVRGKFISNSVGLRNSVSGGNSQFAKSSDDLRAYVVTNIGDISNAAGLSQAYKDRLNASGIKKLSALINRLSQAQAHKLLDRSITDEQLKFIDSKFESSQALMNNSIDGDPRKDAIFSAVYNVNANSTANDENVLRAAAVRACLNGWSGPAVLTFSGCDYHDNTQTTGDNKDLEIGTHIGRVIESAYRLKTPVFIQIITDGGIYPNKGTRIWAGDTVDTCMSVMGYFNPNKAPELRAAPQIGAYTSGQGVDRSTLIGDNPTLAAYAAFANYLSVSGRIAEFEKFAPGIVSDRQLQSLLMF